ncbi:uncharacterized protein RJT20DRAFT_90392 [Scheffersomyces xylosifermentans]|uniref:uncharacterized protein n=1 Tax=Scheffersomyces xylosifermentans TaxID=1304137 RepID=UPI00315DE7EC
MSKDTVLVTGATGYLGNYVVLKLLESGYIVRASVRDLSKEKQLRESFVASSNKSTEEIVKDNLSVFEADITSDANWSEHFDGVKYVLHTASPVSLGPDATTEDYIKPAKAGTLRILKFANEAPSVKHVVLTSSLAAVYTGKDANTPENPYTDDDWTDIEKAGPDQSYSISKTVAEKEAWKYVEGKRFTLTVINPAFIFGEPLKNGTGFSPSLTIIVKQLDGTWEDGAPQIFVNGVDVNDVAQIHVDALTNPRAVGQRFIIHTGETYDTLEIANFLRSELTEEEGKKLPTKLLDVPEEKRRKKRYSSSKKAQEVFNWHPTSFKDAILRTAKDYLANEKAKAT